MLYHLFKTKMKGHFCFSVLLIGLIRSCFSECHFPDFLQPDGRPTSWVIRGIHKESIINVTRSTMIVTECKLIGYRSCQQFERKCSVYHGYNRYLVREIPVQRETTTYEWNSRYYCIQFLKRSKSIVQTKVSKYQSESTSDSLCNEHHLEIELNPMVSRDIVEFDSSECPLTGGYDFNLYQPDDGQAMCHDLFLPLRIESDCTMNEGIKLYFRRRNCSSLFVGRHIESDPVFIKCIATWNYYKYRFSIVKWQGSNDFWCVRVSYKDQSIYEVHFFFSGSCFTTEKSLSGRMLILRNFNIHHVTNICEDQNKLVCSYHKCSTSSRESCKLSCSLCEPIKEERPCSFPSEFYGYWNSLHDPTESSLIIKNSTLQQNHQTWDCVTSTSTEGLPIRRKVLKLKFDNGCHPRYMCMDIEQPAESVLRYRTGKELHWPIEGLEEVCQERYFQYNPVSAQYTGIAATSGPWIYFINDIPKYVTCNLPWYIPKVSFYDMYDKDGKHSNYGCLMNRNGNPGHMIYLHYLHYQDAHKQWYQYLEKSFICLASIRFIGENDVLITQNVEDGVYMCWSFYRDTLRNYVSIYGAKDCGNGTNMQLVHYSAQKALATLVLHTNSSVCDNVENGEKSMTRRSDEALSDLTENNTSSLSEGIRISTSYPVIFITVCLCLCL